MNALAVADLSKEQGKAQKSNLYLAKLVDINAEVTAVQELNFHFKYSLMGSGVHDGREVKVHANMPENGGGNACLLGRMTNALLGTTNPAWVPQDLKALVGKECCMQLITQGTKVKVSNFFPLRKLGADRGF